MQEDVCIILNEREPLKRQMAKELLEQLEQRSYLTERIEPNEHIPKIVLERTPRVLVLDYLLGDVTTALDVLTLLKQHTHNMQVIIWTDEPSVSVAVKAMKLGAKDYVELSPNSPLEKIIASVENCLRQTTKRVSRPAPKASITSPEGLVAQSKVFQHCLSLAQGITKRFTPVVVLLGEPGVGRSTLARCIHHDRRNAGSLIELDLDTWPQPIATICGSADIAIDSCLLSYGSTVMIDHIDFDTGELLEKLCQMKNLVWPTSTDLTNPMLIVGTHSSQIANAWLKLLEAEVLEIPPLSKRQDDIWPLVQRFTQQAQNLLSTNKLKLSPQLIQELTKLPWPGNVKQLRAAIIEVMTTPLSQLEEEVQQTQAPDGKKSKAEPDTVEKEDSLLLRAIQAAKSRWERFHLVGPYEPSPYSARKALETVCGNYRIAAAMLGTGVPQLRAAVAETGLILPENGTGVHHQT